MTTTNNRNEKRRHEISIRVTADELKRLHDRKTDATLAGWMRNLGLGAMPIKQADPNLVRALGRIGSNLNQITRHINTTEEVHESVLTEITAIRKVLTDLLEHNLKGEA